MTRKELEEESVEVNLEREDPGLEESGNVDSSVQSSELRNNNNN